MRPAECCVVRDDTDILPWMIRYYYNIGIRDFYIMMHMPSEELMQCVASFNNLFPDAKFNSCVKNNKSHMHDEDLKVLTDWAKEDGCDWMIPSDSDEVIILFKHNTIQEFLADYDYEEYISLHFKWREYVWDKDVFSPENPFTSFDYAEIDFREQTKSIGKLDSHSWFVPGSHFVMHCANPINVDPEVAICVHFPFRNREQFVEKLVIQNENWMRRYGQFPLSQQIEEDPNFLFKHADVTFAENKVKKKMFVPLNKELFR